MGAQQRTGRRIRWRCGVSIAKTRNLSEFKAFEWRTTVDKLGKPYPKPS